MPSNTEFEEPQLPFFLYGTLLENESNSHVLRHVISRRKAHLEGVQLFDIGPYPMLAEGQGTVHGELVQIDSSHYRKMLRLLDRFEGVRSDAPQQAGGLYHRARVYVEVDAQKVAAWTYFGRESTARRGRLIQNGDWKRRFENNPSTEAARG